ncbi:MAG: ABC transporter ATP-binding protein [Bacteroidia bacterium]|nr:ABC transporter ATP-binding protein [Bacteroidia bacterium]
MIHIKIPEFRYSDNTILRNIQLDLEEGKAYGIVGLNGAGKTTFFRLLSGFLKADGMSILRDNQIIPKKTIAYIDSEIFFYPKLTAGEFLSVFKPGSGHYNEKALSEIFGLPLDKLIDEFSTGMKKKLLLISQIKQNKDIYILDEPFNGLDLETNKLLEVIVRILTQRGKTVFISSHILDPLIHVCEQIHFLKDQRVFRSYSKNEFPSIAEDLFGNYVRELEGRLPGII